MYRNIDNMMLRAYSAYKYMYLNTSVQAKIFYRIFLTWSVTLIFK